MAAPTPVKLNIRIIASATARFLNAENMASVRMELLSRLNVITLNVPPLRDYAQDVPDLLRHYVDRWSTSSICRSAASASPRRIVCGTIRGPATCASCRNLVQRLLILGGEEEIKLEEIERELAAHAPTNEPLVKQDLLALPLREAREHFERAYLQQQLILCNGKVGQLAKRVGMERTHLYRKLRSLGVDFRQLAED